MSASAIPKLSIEEEISVLSSPYTLPSGIVVPNRIWKAACTEGMADPITNLPNWRHNNLYSSWAAGGSGAILTGNVLVDRRYLEGPRNIVLEKSMAGNVEQMDLFRQYAKSAKGPKGEIPVFVQLNHPGRQCPKTITSEPIAPSSVPLKSSKTDTAGLYGVPRAMSLDDIQDLKQRFIDTALLCQETGFSGVQIHSAHGYMLSQFLTPLVNQRTDNYGGSPENRRRLLLEIVSETISATNAVSAKTGVPFGVGVKLNTSDLSLEGGLTEDEAIEIVRELAKLDTDFVEFSGGSYEDGVMLAGPPEYAKESTARREAFFLHFSARARKIVREVSKAKGKELPIIVTGGFTTRRGMAIAVQTKDCEFVGLGRAICVEPDLPGRMLRGEAEKAKPWNLSWGLGNYLFPIGRAWTWFQLNEIFIAERKYHLVNKPVPVWPWGLGIMMRDIYFDPARWWIVRKLYYGSAEEW